MVTVPVINQNQGLQNDLNRFGDGDQGYWGNGNIITDWLMHRDTQGHNDMLNTMAFNAEEAEKAREFEKMMSDAQMQRKVADYLKAGYSPLAALEGNGSYTVSSAPAASAGASSRGGPNNLGAIFGALLATVANVITHGASAAATNSGNAAKAALDAQKLDLLKDRVEVQKGWLDLAKTGNKGVNAQNAEKILRKASHGNNSPKIDWDKLLDDLDKI